MNPDVYPISRTVQPVVFEHLAVEAFRGFNDRVEFDLGASIVIVHGPNGMGKTSLFDAMQWLLLGELPRVANARLRVTEEHIVNAYRQGETAKVAGRVRLGDKVVDLTRVGDRSASTLTWEESGSHPLFGEEAEAALEASFSASREMDLRTSLTACGLLQQDAARLVLKAKPRDRFAIFSQLLGLSDLEQFEDWSQSQAKQAKAALTEASNALLGAERAATYARAQLAQALEFAAQRPAVESVIRRLADLIGSFVVLEIAVPSSRDDAVGVSAVAQRFAQEFAALAVTLVSYIEASETAVPADNEIDEDLAQVDAETASTVDLLASQRASLIAATSALEAARSAKEGLGRMAAAVLPQLTGPDCPVCGQSIELARVRRHLGELAGDDGSVDALSAAVDVLAAEISLSEARLRDAHGRAEDIRRRAQKLASRREELQIFQERLAAVRSSDIVRVTDPPEPMRELLAWLQSVRSEATLLAGVSQEYIAAVDASGGAEEARAAQDLGSAEANVRVRAASTQRAETANQAASLLHEAASGARLDVVRSEFARLAPIAQNVFSRLDPHPTFTELELETDVLRSASTATARVRDVTQGVAADPMVIFSSAQANIAAISYLIALNWTTASRVPVLMLDDPLQAMDDINVLGFADLCRHLRVGRQVIVSTHERRFAQLLERKLTPHNDRDRTIVHEFVGWERSGPIVKERSIGPVGG